MTAPISQLTSLPAQPENDQNRIQSPLQTIQPVRTTGRNSASRQAYADMISPYKNISREIQFDLCHDVCLIQNGNKSAVEQKDFQDNNNPYSTTKMTELQKAYRTIYNDFVLLTLLDQYTPPKNISDQDITRAYSLTKDYLKNNGPNSPFLIERLQELNSTDTLKHSVKLLEVYTPIRITDKLNQNTLSAQGMTIKDFIPVLSKMPFELSGLRHTLIHSDDDRWFELMKYYDIDNQHDNSIMGYSHHKYFDPQRQVKHANSSSSTLKLVLGTGTSAKVIPAFEIATNSLVSFKKYNKYTTFLNDVQKLKSIPDLIPEELKSHFNLPITQASSKGKNSMLLRQSHIVKGGIFFPMAFKTDEFFYAYLNLSKLKEMGRQEKFEDASYAQLKLLAEKTLVLEKSNITHLDLKLENIFGEMIGDCADIAPDAHQLYDKPHTPHVLMPHIKSGVDLTNQVLKTSNRFNLGAMLFQLITGETPMSEFVHSDLALPRDTERNKSRMMKEENFDYGYYLRGFESNSIHQIPDYPNTYSNELLTPYEKGILLLAKKLMAEDRSIAAAENVNLQEEIEKIGRLRMSHLKSTLTEIH